MMKNCGEASNLFEWIDPNFWSDLADEKKRLFWGSIEIHSAPASYLDFLSCF